MAHGSHELIDTAGLLAAIVHSTGDAIISVDLNGILTSWNPAAEHLYGYTPADAIGQPNRLIIPPDRFAEEEDVIRRLRQGEVVPPFETTRIHKNGTRVDVLMTASAIRDASSRIIGISKISRDISVGDEALLASRRLAGIVEHSEDAIISKDLDGIITSWNPAAERMFGYTAREAIGRSIRMIIPSDRQDEEDMVLGRIKRGEGIEHYETVRCRKNGSCLPISLSVSPLRDRHGTVVGASKIARDMTERKLAEEQAAREQSRALFLARMADALSKSADYEQTLDAVAAFAVPTLADWCAVDIVQEDGQIARVAGAHVDPGKAELVRKASEDPGAPYSARQVIRTGTPAMISDVSDDTIAALAGGDEDRIGVLQSIGLESYLCVPFQAGNRTIGALTLASSESSRRYTEDTLRFAEEIASRVALAVENARSYQQIQRANRLKDEFLATLSHELRTPLNAIVGYARMVRGGMMTGEKLHRAIEIIERNSTALTQMVEDLLDVSRIVSGKMRLNVQPVELPLVLTDAVQTMTPAAEAKRIRIRTVVDPLVGPIAGDPDRLRQVVSNLLSNAVKFTPKEGAIQLRLERINSSVEIIVSDTGIGIDADFLPHIFERFRQAESGMGRQYVGLGLGLAIVRNIVEMHGGTINASSDGPGTGATFRVRLPVMIVHPQPLEERRVHPRHESLLPLERMPDLGGTHVFAVDDDPDALRLLKEILEGAGARVTTAASGAAALKEIRAANPDVLVTDIGMPSMDGFEFIRRLRQADDRTVRDIPAAALTAYARSEDRAKTLQSGFQMHLAKPIDPVELASAVKALVGHHKGAR
jgi:PAS domain S-box-containing protein